MYGTSIWWVFCVPPPIRMLRLCILFSTRLCVLSRQCQPFSSQATCFLHVQGDGFQRGQVFAKGEPLTFAIFDGPQLSQFEPVTDELIRELIIKSPTKSCMLDPIPTSITKQCLDDLVSLITFIVNASLSTGIVPPQFK